MSKLINGKSLAAAIRETLPQRIKRLPRAPGLAVLLVGNNPASELYVKLKQQASEALGIGFILKHLPADALQNTIISIIDQWNADPEIDAILVQLPLPEFLKAGVIVSRINPEKDVDGFHPVNTGRFLSGERTTPPVLVECILRLMKSTGKNLYGLAATIVARPSVFTQCLTHALSRLGISAQTVRPNGHHHNATIEADIIVVAAGQPGLVTGEDVKKGAMVIDVGINTLPNGKVVGDVAKSVSRIAGWITPVPGGVGPMTIATLLENVVRLAERNQQ